MRIFASSHFCAVRHSVFDFDKPNSDSKPSANLRRPKGGSQDVKSQLIYSPEQTRFVRDHIGRLLRVMSIRMGITNAEFDRLHALYWESQGGASSAPGASTSQKGNIIKSMEPESITFKAFMKVIEMIYRQDVLSLTIEVKDDIRGTRTYSSTDPLTDIDGLTPPVQPETEEVAVEFDDDDQDAD